MNGYQIVSEATKKEIAKSVWTLATTKPGLVGITGTSAYGAGYLHAKRRMKKKEQVEKNKIS